MTVFVRREDRDPDTQGECHVMMEAEIRVMSPQTKNTIDHWQS